MLSAFFSGMEIAFVSSNRMLAEVDKDKHRLTQRFVTFFYDHPNDFVSAMLVGNNIVLVVYGILIARFLDNTCFAGYSAAFTVPADTIISTLIVLVTAEFLPKILFKGNANFMLTLFSPIAIAFYFLLWPISKLGTLLSRICLRLFGVKIQRQETDDDFSRVELGYLLQTSLENAGKEKEIDNEVKIFRNALDFSETKVRDCMIPRTEIVAVDMEDCSVEDIRQQFIESGHGKIIVYKGDIDHVVGYIHSSELFRFNQDAIAAQNWHDAIQTMPFVPETMAAQKMMKMLLQEKKSLAIVVDEFGGTSGLVALEDMVEEIFGEIEDEHDSMKYVAKQLSDNEYMLSARLEIDKVNEMFGLHLPESDEYMTIGGLILYTYESFPKLNEVVRIGEYEFKIMKNTMTKIELVRLKIV